MNTRRDPVDHPVVTMRRRDRGRKLRPWDDYRSRDAV